jgi:hypothetical protein
VTDLAKAVKKGRDFWQAHAFVNSLIREGLLFIDEAGTKCSTTRHTGFCTFSEVIEKKLPGFLLDK